MLPVSANLTGGQQTVSPTTTTTQDNSVSAGTLGSFINNFAAQGASLSATQTATASNGEKTVWLWVAIGGAALALFWYFNKTRK